MRCVSGGRFQHLQNLFLGTDLHGILDFVRRAVHRAADDQEHVLGVEPVDFARSVSAVGSVDEPLDRGKRECHGVHGKTSVGAILDVNTLPAIQDAVRIHAYVVDLGARRCLTLILP